MFDFSIILQEWHTYLQGLGNTVWLVAVSLILGLSIAIPLGICRNSANPLLRLPAWAYIYFFRGTPMLVQLFIIYYGAGQWDGLRNSWAWEWFQEAWFCALLSFTLNTAAYTAEIVRGAIRTIPKGEIEAAQAFGMTPWQTMSCILLPSALRRALPAYSNEVILMLHSTALAFTATVPDLLKIARDINSATYQPFTAFGIAAVLYLIISYVLISLFRKAEKRWLQHMKPSSTH